MRTVHEVSKLTGLTIRTLRHYDDIGLLKVQRTGEGVSNDRKLYSDEDIEKLFTIMIYKELDVPLKEIKRIMQAPSFDRSKALGDQIEELKVKRRHLSNIITCAEFIYAYGTELVSGNDFSPSGIDRMAKQIRSSTGYKKARSLDKEQMNSYAKKMRTDLEQLASISDLEEYRDIEHSVVSFAESFAAIADLNVSEGILTSLAFMFFSEDGAFSVAVDEIGGDETHLAVMYAFLLVCLKNWEKSIIPLARKAIDAADVNSDQALWDSLEKSFGKELKSGASTQDFFDYVWVCFWMGMMLLEDDDVRSTLGMNVESRISEAEAMLLQKRLADLVGVEANVEIGGN